MDYGISSFKGLNPSWWVKDAVLSAIKLNSINLRRNSQKYLPLYIGGHARECIGEAVLAKKKGFHGAIQIYPVGCMPEIVSRAILPSISKDENFPIMTLVVDEMTGEAGYVTRLEAFIDLIERNEKNVVYGC
jgi:predicted nucleotide-binding protein (sugar kinase/HSP70/actin superfamily)